jgi:hypothetical protein
MSQASDGSNYESHLPSSNTIDSPPPPSPDWSNSDH